MEGCLWKILLLVWALSDSGGCAPTQAPMSYEEAVEQGVVMYNSKAKEDHLYRLLEAVPQPDWDPNSEGTQELKFSLKETVCTAEEEGSLDKCDFKEGGVVRQCAATFFLGEKPPMAVLNCEAVEGIEEEEEKEEVEEVEEKEEEDEKGEEEEDQPERSRKLRKKIRKALRKGLKKIGKGLKKGIQIVKKVIIGIII
ncbi:cathelicidin-related peptide-like [Erythrolamprus reginae]|uniref:cathelicidin-related peptide-like n=1 Tax=Erythrolamprus reginae TaxID=121349 RepID=UPI00396C7778